MIFRKTLVCKCYLLIEQTGIFVGLKFIVSYRGQSEIPLLYSDEMYVRLRKVACIKLCAHRFIANAILIKIYRF